MQHSLHTILVLTCFLFPLVSIGSPESADGEMPYVAEGTLAGTAWQLVGIISPDGRKDVPEDRSRYTVEFMEDGSFLVVADCNRGTGSWSAASRGQLQLGVMAATQAMCLPGSLHDPYMAELSRVSAYELNNSQLFLATMADDSGLEFEPLQVPLAATVLGEEVRSSDAAEMQEVVLTRLFDRYAEQQGIEVTDSEIDAYVETMQQGMRDEGLAAEDDLTPEEAVQVEQMRRDMGRAMIRQWKLNRALYRQYGGRIIFQQLGPEPLDAYRQYLEARQAAGDFTIHRKDFEDAFWGYFTTDSMHDFYAPGSDEEAQAFKTPFWERTETGTAAAAGEATSGALGGTRWRLVRFQSMDDATGEIEPDDPSVYTMTLNEDGSVSMQLNCNRATGTWRFEPASDGLSGTFTFGPLATTRALCPPPSMDERIARDAEWVRGFLLKNGQLHLSLMADAGIYSWERLPGGAGEATFASAPDPDLEDALRAVEPYYTRETVDITGNEGRYVYGRVDLNADGRTEVFVLLMGSIFCGTGGCNLYLFSDAGEGYSLVSTFPRSRLPVIVSPRKTAGWHDLVRLETGGGVTPSYVRHAFDGETYIEQERLPTEPIPEGALLLNGEYSYASGFPLEPRSE